MGYRLVGATGWGWNGLGLLYYLHSTWYPVGVQETCVECIKGRLKVNTVHWPGSTWRTGAVFRDPRNGRGPPPRSRRDPSPLRHDLKGIWQVALHILHLERVSIADFVICAPVVGVLHHDDVTAWAPQLNGVAFTCQLSAHQSEWEPSPAQACEEQGRASHPGHSEGTKDPAEEVPPPAWLYPGHRLYKPHFIHL